MHLEAELSYQAEVGLASFRVSHHEEGKNDEVLLLNLDLLDEVRAITEQILACYQDFMANHYNTHVKPSTTLEKER